MTLQYDHLKKLDTGRNILTIPLRAGTKTWGVLNIEDLPFEKYSFHSERLLQIIVGLAEPHLGRALEYERITSIGDVDEITGIPLYSQFYRLLEGEVERAELQAAPVSVVVFDIGNFTDLSERFGQGASKLMLKDLIEDLTLFSDSRHGAFHYREDGQFVFLCPGLDHDGASLYCLDALEKINRREWKIAETTVALETTVGYATARAGTYDVEAVLQQAEHLLLLQKV
jgi:diguanylate cyclase (GGDEF)-like protein